MDIINGDIVNGFDEPAEQAYALICAIYRASEGFAATIEETFPTLAAFVAYLDELKKRPGAIFLLAKQGEALGAYLFLEPRPLARLAHTADLNMGVVAACRGQGTGQRLLAHACRQAQACGVLEILYLMVRADNLAAVRLYERSGFTLQARLRRDIKIGSDYFEGLLMAKFL